MIRRLSAHWGLLLVLGLYLALVGFASWRTPLAQGPDEVAHFMFARFIAEEGRLPLSPEEREVAGYKSDQPPLNSVLVAAAAVGIDLQEPPYVKLTHDLPRRHLPGSGTNSRAFSVINTEDPLTGELLFWWVGRLMSMLFSAAALGLVYWTAWETFDGWPRRRWWALSAVTSVAFIPTFIFISAVFSYENLLGLWLALYLLLAVYIFKRPDPAWRYLLAGLSVGLALVTKLSALVAPFSLLGLTLWVAWRAGWRWPKLLGRLALGGAGIFLGAGWWIILIELQLNRVAELGWVLGLLYPFASDKASLELAQAVAGHGDGAVGVLVSPADLWRWVKRIFQTFWVFQNEDQRQILPFVTGAAGLSVAGLAWRWRKVQTDRPWLLFLLGHTALFFILPLVRFFTTGFVNETGQGHHVLFPALGAVAILLVWGLGSWVPARRWGWLGGVLLGLGLLGWNIAYTGFILEPDRPAPVRTAPPLLPDQARPLSVDFGPVALQGFQTSLQDGPAPALKLNLYWLSQDLATEDYLTQVTLVDDQAQPQSVWLGHGGGGFYPTRAWEPGDIVRDEIYLPLPGLPPGDYRLRLQLLAADHPLQPESGQEFIELETITLTEPPAPLAAALWQRGQIETTPPTFGERQTIQLTTPAGPPSLLGPDQSRYPPRRSAGHTHVFIVDPLWPRGEYRIEFAADKTESPLSTATGLEVTGPPRQTAIPPSQFAVEANFAGYLKLLGYNLPQRNLSPGGKLPVALHWQALQPIPTDFIMFTRLRDETGQAWGGYDRWPREYYSPLLWAAGEVVEDGFTVPLKPDTPPGLYYLDVGFYFPLGESTVSLPLVQNGELSQATSVTLGPFEVGDLPVTPETVAPQHPLAQPFGDPPALTLLGYDFTAESGQPITNNQLPITEALHLTLYWQSEAPTPVDYTTFIHLRNQAGQTVAQKDQPPLEGAYPTSLWEPGEIIADKLVLTPPPELPAGAYQLVVGLYDVNTGRRLAVPGQPEDSLILTTLELHR